MVGGIGLEGDKFQEGLGGLMNSISFLVFSQGTIVYLSFFLYVPIQRYWEGCLRSKNRNEASVFTDKNQASSECNSL